MALGPPAHPNQLSLTAPASSPGPSPQSLSAKTPSRRSSSKITSSITCPPHSTLKSFPSSHFFRPTQKPTGVIRLLGSQAAPYTHSHHEHTKPPPQNVSCHVPNPPIPWALTTHQPAHPGYEVRITVIYPSTGWLWYAVLCHLDEQASFVDAILSACSWEGE
jgi:hypothetical protein